MNRPLHSPVLLALVCVLVAGCGSSGCGASTSGAATHPQRPAPAPRPAPAAPEDGTAAPVPPGLAVATFAGGCFWCIEYAFEHLPGVRDAISGYTGGPERNPSYEAVSNHRTGHAEAVRVLYDPAVVTYEQLLDLFWRRIDPTAVDRSFADVGHQYRSAIYVHTPAQRAAATRSRDALAASGRFREPIVTPIEDATTFWVAEDYHQDFWRTTPGRFNDYHENSGRREFLRAHWGPDAPY